MSKLLTWLPTWTVTCTKCSWRMASRNPTGADMLARFHTHHRPDHECTITEN